METKTYQQNMKVLKEITNNVPERLKNNLMKTVINTEQEEAVRSLIKDSKLHLKMREKLQKELDNGDFRFKEKTINPEVEKELDVYYEREVKKAIKEGRLSSPDEDPYYQKMVARFDKVNSK